jgi:hypothetical protein
MAANHIFGLGKLVPTIAAVVAFWHSPPCLRIRGVNSQTL